MIFCVFLSLSVHEACHGLVAYLGGDRTAKYSGRLSINPFHHLDLFGTLSLLLFGFGWAKPVPVNPWNFKNKKLGMALTALGGPVSNLILGFIGYIGWTFINPGTVFSLICYYLVIYNIGLGVFNLIPIPPLDGSKILNAILPQRYYFKLMQYERYGFIVLIILINLPFFNSFLALMRSGILSFYDIIIQLFI
ncbi:MAG: site-2 protease family protein [Clostridia bacterium]|nr:site-2 protease family protein [Clostridia bacterium]